MGLNQSPDTSSKEQTLLNDSNIYFIYSITIHFTYSYIKSQGNPLAF